MDKLLVFVALLAVLAMTPELARRLRAPQPVMLALVGLALAFVPGLPRTPLDPDLILALFLPPILYADAFQTSWVDFKRWLRPILMLAVGLVGFTILCVGLAAHALLPELPWSVCFLLGALVSPTDTVAVQAVIEKMRVPRRLTAILSGESLVNDATGLVGVQLAVAVTLSGVFDAGEITRRFAWVAGIGIAVGVGIGLVFSLLNRLARQTPVLFVLSLIAPYLALDLAHRLESSGVLAVVVAGFIVSWRFHVVPAAARVDLFATWTLLVWILNGMCFVLIGVEVPHLVAESADPTRGRLLAAGLVISAVVVLCRVLWIFPGAYVPLWLSPKARRREGGFPPWRNVVLASWCGVRGVISLAAALAIPLTLPDGSAFPGRRQVLACTLCVILVTLFVQGMTLEPLVRRLGVRGDEDGEAEVRAAREALLSAGIRRLDAFCSERSCPISVHHWRTMLVDELASLRDEDADKRTQARSRLEISKEVRQAVADEQGRELLALRDDGRINDRTYLFLQLDLDRAAAQVSSNAAPHA
jgi:CPA1 family monovalent cation:H+ antiporter